jgi:anaerobic glycerol-3-phosphate dehydrogenase
MVSTNNRHSDSLYKSQLTLFQGITKKGDVVIDADNTDDEVRTIASQNHATATLCTDEFF